MKNEQRIGVCPFAVIGDPTAEEFLDRMAIYLKHKPDFIELGIPFSDPVADGPTVAQADERALANGMNTTRALELVKKLRAQTDIPIGLLVYANTVLQFGIEKFYETAQKSGVDSVLVADVPLEEAVPFATTAKENNIHHIVLVSQYTDASRLKKIEKIGSGFLYVVGTMGVTGARKEMDPALFTLLKRLKKQTSLPLVVGFGISQRAHIEQLEKAGADGAIIGSKLVGTPTPQLDGLLQTLQTPPHSSI
ncbi:tryptophan synthase subunit alpha [Candidatus Gracilibacteria bacterium]|nr:tryptophan synthase subunit alpha [Candidatus Gracilibacteria bacterium]